MITTIKTFRIFKGVMFTFASRRFFRALYYIRTREDSTNVTDVCRYVIYYSCRMIKIFRRSLRYLIGLTSASCYLTSVSLIVYMRGSVPPNRTARVLDRETRRTQDAGARTEIHLMHFPSMCNYLLCRKIPFSTDV